MLNKKDGCYCNPAYIVVALVLFAVGLWVVAEGLRLQIAGADMWTTLPWYFIGVAVFWGARWLKWHSHGWCPVHYQQPKRKK